MPSAAAPVRPPVTPTPHPASRQFPESLASQVAERGLSLPLMLGLGVLAFGLVPFWIITRKHRSMMAAREELSRVSWEGNEWVPPKIQMSTFKKPGEIGKELTALEAAVLSGGQVSQIIALMLKNLEQKGVIHVLSGNPLRIERKAEGEASLDPYEKMLLQGMQTDGTVPVEHLNKTFLTIASGLQQKLWNCDHGFIPNRFSEKAPHFRNGKPAYIYFSVLNRDVAPGGTFYF